MHRWLRLALTGLAVMLVLSGAGRYWVAAQQEDSPWEVIPSWDEPVDLTSEVSGPIYQALTLTDRVVATTFDAIWDVRSQEARLQTPLEFTDGLGEFAILPRNLVADETAMPLAGLLLQGKDFVTEFRLFDVIGNRRGRPLPTPFFYYRMAPDGRSYVGIEGGGGDSGFDREQLTYGFNSEQTLFQSILVESPAPQLEMDSAYTPDGGAFLISSRAPKQGLRAYSPFTASLLWQIDQPVRSFSPANSETTRVLAVDDFDRSVVRLHDGNQLLWQIDAADFGADGNVRHVEISPNGEYSAFTSNHMLVVVPPGGPDESFVFDDRPDLSINSLAINDKGIVVIGAQAMNVAGNEPTTGAIFVFDASGNLLFYKETVHQVSNAWIPTVQFDPTGTSFSVRTMEEMWLYELVPVIQ